MALRTIDYTVSLSGISPATQQFGGVQGEHNATALKFTLNADLLASIKAQAGGNKVVYRFDVYDGAGGLTSTDSAPLTDSPPSYLLENKVSRMGGNVQVFLIITEIKDGETQMDLYSFPAVLRLKEKQEGEVSEAENYESISTLAEVAKESASVAENSAAIAKEAQIKTEKSKLALESGTVWVFDGGRPSGKIDIDLVVDSTLDPQSKNPLQNDIITNSIEDLTEQISKILLEYIPSEDANMRYLKHDDVADYPIEFGKSGIWTYEKWASGKAACWGRTRFNDITFGTNNNNYFSWPPLTCALPIGLFAVSPYCSMNAFPSDGSIGWSSCVGGDKNEIKFYIVKDINTGTISADINFYCVGTWKSEE